MIVLSYLPPVQLVREDQVNKLIKNRQSARLTFSRRYICLLMYKMSCVSVVLKRVNRNGGVSYLFASQVQKCQQKCRVQLP